MTFRAALSLGNDCTTAFALDRRFGIHASQSLFDWLVTPFTSIASILEDEGARLGRDFKVVNRGASVRCEHYGVLYHHEFPRSPEGDIVFSSEAIAACRSKMIHKYTKMMSVAAGGPVLFFRSGLGCDVPGDDHAHGRVPASTVNRVTSCLERSIGHGEFALVLQLRVGMLCGRMISDSIDHDAELDRRVRVASVDPEIFNSDLPQKYESIDTILDDYGLPPTTAPLAFA